MGITPDTILKLGGGEEGTRRWESRIGSTGCEGGRWRIGHDDRRKFHQGLDLAHRWGPGREGKKGSHSQDRNQRRSAAEGASGEGGSGERRPVFEVEDSMVEAGPEIGRDVEGVQFLEKFLTCFVGMGIAATPPTCVAMGFHLLRNLLLDPSIYELGIAGQELLAIHRRNDTPKDR